MNKHILALALGLVVLSACATDRPNKQAERLLQEAEDFLQADDYVHSIAMVDSAMAVALSDTAILRRSIGLKKVIRLREAEKKSAELIHTIETLHQAKDIYMKQVGISMGNREAYGVQAAPTYTHSALPANMTEGIVWTYDAETNTPKVRVLVTGATPRSFTAIRLPDLLLDTLWVDAESLHQYELEGKWFGSASLSRRGDIETLKNALISLDGSLPNWIQADSLPARKPMRSLRVDVLDGDKVVEGCNLTREQVNALREMALMTQLLQRIRQSELGLAKYLQRQQRLNAQLTPQD